MAIRHALGLVFAVAVAMAASPACAKTYTDTDRGYRVSYPDSWTTCPPGFAGSGVMIALDTGNPQCFKMDVHPHMGIAGDFNTAFWQTPKDAHKGPCGKAPDLPPLGNRPSLNCQSEKGGWIDISIIAVSAGRQGKDVNFPEDSNAPEIVYTAWLHTTRERLTHDLAAFRDLVKAVRVFK